jgi:hypothetical protein
MHVKFLDNENKCFKVQVSKHQNQHKKVEE